MGVLECITKLKNFLKAGRRGLYRHSCHVKPATAVRSNHELVRGQPRQTYDCDVRLPNSLSYWVGAPPTPGMSHKTCHWHLFRAVNSSQMAGGTHVRLLVQCTQEGGDGGGLGSAGFAHQHYRSLHLHHQIQQPCSAYRVHGVHENLAELDGGVRHVGWYQRRPQHPLLRLAVPEILEQCRVAWQLPCEREARAAIPTAVVNCTWLRCMSSLCACMCVCARPIIIPSASRSLALMILEVHWRSYH